MPSYTEIVAFVDAVGVLGILALLLVGGALASPLWVYGWYYRAEREARVKAEAREARLTAILERMLDVVEQMTDQRQPRFRRELEEQRRGLPEDA